MEGGREGGREGGGGGVEGWREGGREGEREGGRERGREGGREFNYTAGAQREGPSPKVKAKLTADFLLKLDHFLE